MALRQALNERSLLVHVLGLFAAVAAAESTTAGAGAARRALELGGAFVALAGEGRLALGRLDYHLTGPWLDVARQALSESDAAAAWERGRSLSLDQGLRLAVSAPNGESDAAAAPGRRVPTHRGHDELTARERDVAALLASGKTNREIAAALTIAEGTAGLHAKRVLAKLGLRSRAQLAARSDGVAQTEEIAATG